MPDQRRGFSYRHRNAAVGLMAPLECGSEFIFDTEAKVIEFARANLRDPHEYVVLGGTIDWMGSGHAFERVRLTPDYWTDVPRE